jgi:hypothetical protein
MSFVTAWVEREIGTLSDKSGTERQEPRDLIHMESQENAELIEAGSRVVVSSCGGWGGMGKGDQWGER